MLAPPPGSKHQPPPAGRAAAGSAEQVAKRAQGSRSERQTTRTSQPPPRTRGGPRDHATTGAARTHHHGVILTIVGDWGNQWAPGETSVPFSFVWLVHSIPRGKNIFLLFYYLNVNKLISFQSFAVVYPYDNTRSSACCSWFACWLLLADHCCLAEDVVIRLLCVRFLVHTRSRSNFVTVIVIVLKLKLKVGWHHCCL